MEGSREDDLIFAMCHNSIKSRLPSPSLIPRSHLAKSPSLIMCCFSSCEGSALRLLLGEQCSSWMEQSTGICECTGMTNPSLVSCWAPHDTSPATRTCWQLGHCSGAWSEASQGEGRKFPSGFQPTRQGSLIPGAAVAQGWQLLAALGCPGLLVGPKGGNSCCSSWGSGLRPSSLTATTAWLGAASPSSC